MKNLRPAIFAALVGLALVRLCRGDDLSVKIVRTIEITRSQRYCWFPTVHRFPSGRIMVTMRMSPDETNPEGDFSAVCFSEDGGLTWSHRFTMGAGANVDGAYSTVPEPNGTIWNLYGWIGLPARQGSLDFPGTLTVYRKDGDEFTQTRQIIFRLLQPVSRTPTCLYGKDHRDAHLMEVPSVNPFGPIVKGLDGSWLAPIEFAPPGTKDTRIGIVRSTDGGHTWVQIGTEATAWQNGKRLRWVGDEGPDESSFVRLADKRLYSIFRTGNGGYMGQCWSSDDGRTWTAPTSTGVAGVAPRLRRLSGGALACTYGRPGPVTIMFSVDGTGRTWTHATPIFSDMSTRYTDFIEVSPGHLLVVYDSVPYGWDPIPEDDTVSRNCVYAALIDVSKP